ncbi:MAG: hypothetical protein HY927_10310 [Elusimicrobia bacterium]|nr:hypothetical protein [Elusimicrobiota bacterium]
MNRQRRPSLRTSRRAFAALAAAAAALALCGRANAVTMSIDSTMVMVRNCKWFPASTTSAGVRFQCPMDMDGAVPSPIQAACALATGDDAGNVINRLDPMCGNISNDPRIEFEDFSRGGCYTPYYDGGNYRANLPQYGSIAMNACNDAVFLCAAVKYGNELGVNLTIDEISFAIFKFQDGSNQNDSGSTPPIKSFYIDSPGTMSSSANTIMAPMCVYFDGAVNIQGEQGKTNGTYGFRVTAKTQIQNQQGNITITAERSYPSGTTLAYTRSDGAPQAVGQASGFDLVPQKPVTVDVTNVHVLAASVTVVGRITGVSVAPYNFAYRLSKDASMRINVFRAVDVAPNSACAPDCQPIRHVVNGAPRSGEGVPKGTLVNGDSWNGKADNGDVVTPGIYMATFEAEAYDQFGRDISYQTTRQISLDPLHVTDIRVSPLMAGSTSLATLTYILTEPATVYIDVYPPNTQFCDQTPGVNPLNNVNDSTIAQDQASPLPPKDFNPRFESCAGTVINPLRRISEFKPSRADVVTYWDGTNQLGEAVPDGDYVYVIYASLPSQNGYVFNGNGWDRRVWTSQGKTGFIPVVRGMVGLTQVTPASTVIGSSPPVAGINPFYFRYTLSREATVNLRVYDASGKTLVKTIVQNELRPGLFGNQETWWDGADDTGRIVSSGTYLVQLTASDPMFPAKVSTMTAMLPIDMFRITDINTTPLLGGASESVTLNFQLSQTMNMAWNIYPPGTVIERSTATWPPCGSITPAAGCTQILRDNQATPPVFTQKGLRVGRQRYTEYWDGRDSNGLYVPDGLYVFTLTAESTQTPRYFATDKINGTLSVARGQIVFTSFAVKPELAVLYNSSSTIELHPFSIEYGLNRQSSVTIAIMTTAVPAQVIRTVVAGGVRDANILLQDVWDGRDDRGNWPKSGLYNVRITAEDMASVLSSGSTNQITITYEPLRIYDTAVAPLRADSPEAVISYQVSEPMKVALKIYRPGTIFDMNGNPSPGEATSLVKRIVGLRPARTLIEDAWNGTDLKQAVVPDGVYKFKLVGSTDAAAIDDLTGNVRNPGALALDKPIDDIPVVRLGISDPFGNFMVNTFVYPNPVKGATAHFKIYVPIQGAVKLKLYSMSGGNVLDKDFGERAQDSYVDFDWNKTNQAGKPVGRGMYWAVFRLEETIGGRSVLQIVKKVLLP